MSQLQVKATSVEVESTSSIKAKFESISSKPVTRNVKLLYSSCCGCGCSDIEILRTVPYESPLSDGDRAAQLLDSDEVV
jgi:hypothetical protein